MEGFDPAVNGWFDADDQLPRWLRARAHEGFAAERARKRALDSRSAFETRRERVRDRFVATIGGLPDRPVDPSVESREAVERDGYAVETVTFESRPGFHVTANCYVPDGTGPHPGVLFCCGHVTEAKTDPMNQRACIELALNGFVVLAVDPVAQGERRQYRDPETGEALVAGGGVFAHCYAGQQCLYAGANLARWMVHDARCGLDYLERRADVDADRLGVTGTSGGGVQTLYLSLVDDRVAAAAPCCAVTDREEWLDTGKRVDAEQLLPGAIPAGVNYDDFLAAMAPRPVCVGAAASDEYFPIGGVHTAVERTRRVYELYDAADNLELVVADERHCSVYELGDGVFEFLCGNLGDREFVDHGPHDPHDAAALHCTPEGSVVAAYPDERTIDDLIRAYVAERTEPVPEPRGVDPARVRERVTERFDLDRERPDRHLRRVAEREADGLTVEYVFFETERNPAVVVTGVLVSDPDAAARSPAVVCYERGTEELADRRDEVTDLAAEHGTVLVVDPRGVGAVRSREIPIPNWVDDYDGVYGTEFKLAYDAILLGRSLFGLRVYDVLGAVEFLRDETGASEVSFVGEGVGAYHALYAAVAGDGVDAVTLRNLGASFREMATSREYDYDPRLTVFDVLDCDVPHLLAALDGTGVDVERD